MFAAGFADPVLDGQHAFRVLLDALARPGRAVAFPSGLHPPAPLTPELAAVALAFADPDAPLWLDEPLAANDAVSAFLRFHTGATVTPDARDAAFVLVADGERLPAFEAFSPGTDEYPDRSATIVVALPRLDGGRPLRLTGPGIADETIASPPLPPGFSAAWAANGALFPRGIDLVLVARGAVLGLPRSTRAEEAA